MYRCDSFIFPFQRESRNFSRRNWLKSCKFERASIIGKHVTTNSLERAARWKFKRPDSRRLDWLTFAASEYASKDVALAKWLHWKAIRDRSKPGKRLKRVVFGEALFSSLATRVGRIRRGWRREGKGSKRALQEGSSLSWDRFFVIRYFISFVDSLFCWKIARNFVESIFYKWLSSNSPSSAFVSARKRKK